MSFSAVGYPVLRPMVSFRSVSLSRRRAAEGGDRFERDLCVGGVPAAGGSTTQRSDEREEREERAREEPVSARQRPATRHTKMVTA